MHRLRPPAPARQPLVLSSALLAAFLIGSCGGDGDGPTEMVVVSLAKASGDAQTGAVSAPLIEPLVVRVTDQNGGTLQGRTVAWSVTSGQATPSSSTSSSNASGLASIQVTLGAQGGEVTISASIGDSEVEFTATGLVPAAISIVGGDDQNGRTLTAFAAPLVVRVATATGTPVPGARVDWSVTSGAATLDASSVVADFAGQANVGLTGGTSLGDVSVLAELSGSASSVTFSGRVTVFVIDMINTAFEAPTGAADATVAVGDTVEWFNRDIGIGAHTATSSSTPAGGSAFDSGNMAVNARFRFVPDAVGTWDYFCVIHGVAAMSGTLTAQ